MLPVPLTPSFNCAPCISPGRSSAWGCSRQLWAPLLPKRCTSPSAAAKLSGTLRRLACCLLVLPLFFRGEGSKEPRTAPRLGKTQLALPSPGSALGGSHEPGSSGRREMKETTKPIHAFPPPHKPRGFTPARYGAGRNVLSRNAPGCPAAAQLCRLLRASLWDGEGARHSQRLSPPGNK